MLLKLRCMRKEEFFCVEKIVAIICDYYKRDYRMIFSDIINCYNVSNVEELIKRIETEPKVDEEKLFFLLEKFHGIEKYKFKSDDRSEIIEYITNQLKLKNPIAVLIDILYQPWLSEKDRNYYKMSKENNNTEEGVLIINGRENGNFICLDVHYSNKEEIIPIDCLREGVCIEDINCFHVYEDNKNVNMCLEFIYHNIFSFFEKNEFGLDLFAQMRLLLDGINEFQVYKGDNNKYGYRQLYYLKGCLNRIYRERYLFSLALEYVTKLCGNEMLTILVGRYKETVSRWYMALLFLMKIHIKKGYVGNDKEKLSRLIEHAINEEEQIMMLWVRHNCKFDFNQSISKIDKKMEIYERKNINPYYIDLSEYLNNNSFMCAYGMQEEVFNSFSLVKNQYYFRLSDNISSLNNDNISCKNQEIILPREIRKYIQILGYGEDGNFSGFAQVEYYNEMRESFVIELSRYDKKYGYDLQYESNEVMWLAIRNNGEYPIKGYISKRRNMRLCAMEYELKEDLCLNKLILPDIPYMHILAITLI